MNDAALLTRFARDGDHDAFAELVRLHADLVYATALRATGGDVHMAHDVTQRVFIALARKATDLARHPALLGWLHRAAWMDATALRRREARRRAREEAAVREHLLATAGVSAPGAPTAPPADEPEWPALAPLLDDALARLPAADREAILARHVAGLPFAAVGARLGIAENTARMRTDRALEKLRRLLARRGVTSTAAALGVCLSAHAGATAPAELVRRATEAALAAAPAAGSATVGAGGLGAVWLAGLVAFLRLGLVQCVLVGAALLTLGWALLGKPAFPAPTVAVVPAIASGDHSSPTTVAPEPDKNANPFMSPQDYVSWYRRVVAAGTPDEAFRLLHEGGVTLSRAAFDRAQQRRTHLLETWGGSEMASIRSMITSRRGSGRSRLRLPTGFC